MLYCQYNKEYLKEVIYIGDVLVKTRVRNNGKVVYEYRFEIASVDGKRKWKTKSGFPTKTAAKEAGKLVDSYNKKIRLYISPKLGKYRLKSIF